MPTRIFLPLRSNTTWFTDAEAVSRFERLLRTHIALYDRIILEDGTLRISADSDGQGFAFMIPPESTEADRTKISFCEPGGTFAIAVRQSTVLHGKSSFGCSADFRPVLHRAGLIDATYFQWTSGELVPEVKQKTDELADRDFRDKKVGLLLPSQSFVRKELLKGFYRDAIVAHVLNMPFGIDRHLGKFLQFKRQNHERFGLPAIAHVLLDHWIKLELPDFSQYSWQEIHELHESDIGEDLRRMVERVCQSVTSALPANATEADISDLVQQALNRELIAELRSRRADVGKTAVNLLMNFVPYGSVFSGVLEANSLAKDQASWISLL